MFKYTSRSRPLRELTSSLCLFFLAYLKKNLILALGRHIYLTKSLHSSSMKVTQRGKTSYITHTDIATYRLNWHRDRFSESFTWKNKFAINMNLKRRRY